MKRQYPRAIYLRDIKKGKRVCCQCGDEICGHGHHMFIAAGPGKYLCWGCEIARNREKKEGASL